MLRGDSFESQVEVKVIWGWLGRRSHTGQLMPCSSETRSFYLVVHWCLSPFRSHLDRSPQCRRPSFQSPDIVQGSRSGDSRCGRAAGRSSASALGSPDLSTWLTSTAVPVDLLSPRTGLWCASAATAASMIRPSAS